MESDLKREDPVRDRAMQLVLDLGGELGLRRGDWRITIRRMEHVDDEQLRRALTTLGRLAVGVPSARCSSTGILSTVSRLPNLSAMHWHRFVQAPTRPR